jgi:hypothetical protein
VLTTSSGNPANIGNVLIDGSANVTLSAPTDSSSPYKGVLFFQDRRATVGTATFTSGTTLKLSGVLYFPNTPILFSGSTAVASPCATVVGKTIKFATGSPGAVNIQGCANSNYQLYNIGGGVRLVS